MGRVYTPTYRVEAASNVPGLTIFGWCCRTNGRATDKNADRWRKGMNQSFQPGGNNWHVSKANGVVPHLHEVRIVRQRTGEVVAVASAPMFEVV